MKKEIETHSSILALEVPWTEEPGEYSRWGGKRVGYDLAIKQQQNPKKSNDTEKF